jgi:hypothetical protein
VKFLAATGVTRKSMQVSYFRYLYASIANPHNGLTSSRKRERVCSIFRSS